MFFANLFDINYIVLVNYNIFLNTYVLYHALASLAALDNRPVLPHPPGPYTTNGDRQLERI